MDQVVDELATGLGVPGKVIRADADVAALRRARTESALAAQRETASRAEIQSMAVGVKSLADTAKIINDMKREADA